MWHSQVEPDLPFTCERKDAVVGVGKSIHSLQHNCHYFQKEQPRSPNIAKPDTQQVYEILLKMLDRWNAHDIEGYMEVYWKSPELLVVVDSEQFNGWQQLHDSYLNGYPDRNAMGFIKPKRIQVKLLKPDLALALTWWSFTWWSFTFPSSKQSVVGNSTMNLQKFKDGWKIVASQTSIAQI